ncbi:acyl-protein thioesterase 1,2-like isoform X1 [Acyrthosiphon pisum]|uniref:palmitoyl-protein hydrolase n=1 Tax=Acyrthosiphon pisum TaxID=7029 RepID=C4WUC3_ACYPI|nr:acyl-protein thioesterase 1,2-like [Acyrthosiphon pisum]XP_008181110.1 acyl-protein thioesterase 1,2-like isoform X1 [Acyrthosiphon pisum]BAH71493.1 ACYPI002721 [Acyrthosiphon pisum]|eukprot:NP_001156119.1 acyl-protein thioesterase 1,2-like [Acyrthosiphon pisum]
MSEDAFIVSPTRKHTGTIIFLHGLGENGENWKHLLSKMVKPNIKVVCLNAKKIPLTLNKGFPTAAWFDLASLDENKLEDESTIMRAVDKLHDIIDEEIASSKVSSTKTMLAGFSQGGALAMYAALTYHKRLAAVMVMSSWPVLRHTMPDAAINNTNTPMLQCHGTEDPVIFYKWGLILSEALKEMNPNKYEFKSYEGLMHAVNEQELEDVKNFINKIFP